jgi:hypothetical protein
MSGGRDAGGQPVVRTCHFRSNPAPERDARARDDLRFGDLTHGLGLEAQASQVRRGEAEGARVRYCRECGAGLAEDAAFCKECGTPVAAATPPTTPAIAAQPAPGLAALTPEAAPTDGPVAPKAGPGWLTRNRLLVASRVLLVLGLLGGGILIGWAMGSDEDLVKAEAAPPTPATSASAQPTGPVMPDVRGLDAADAQQVLADVGVAAQDVSLTDAPAAGESGLVIAQTPVYGYAIDGPVTLSVSTPAVVPKFKGRPADEVLDELDELGAQVDTTSRFLPDVPVGEIASIDPPPGSPLPETVSVTISAEPDELALVEVSPVDDTCFTDQDSINGTSYDDLLVCSTDSSAADQAWLIGRAGARLTGVVGVPDSSDPSSSMTVQIIGDGQVLASFTATYGSEQPLDVDVTGVLRLTIRYGSTTNDYGDVGLGHLTLLGDADLLAALTS